jgi:hypothetical protein
MSVFIVMYRSNRATSSRKARKSVSGTGKNRLLMGAASGIISCVAHAGTLNAFRGWKLLNTSMLRHILSSMELLPQNSVGHFACIFR